MYFIIMGINALLNADDFPISFCFSLKFYKKPISFIENYNDLVGTVFVGFCYFAYQEVRACN